MDTTSNDMAKSANHAVDNAADKVRSGLNDVQQSTKGLGSTIGNKVDEFGRGARHMLDSGSDQVKQGIDSVKESVQGAREKVSSSGDALITYTKNNPVTALMFAAVSGAVLWTLLKAVGPSRE